MSNRRNRGHRKYEEKVARDEVRAKTDGQYHYLNSIENHVLTYCSGPAGCGKTTLAVGMACQYILDPQSNISTILITRPIVDCGKSIGFLPGNEREKLHPYLVPILEEMKYYIGLERLRDFQDQGRIEVCPIEHMRGRNYHNTFMILDEAQNAEYKQIKNFLTRVGQNSIVVLNGDETQTDLPDRLAGGFREAIEKTQHLDEVGYVELDDRDCVRSNLVKTLISLL